MSSSAVPNLTLILEPTDDTFLTKRLNLVDNVPIKIGRTVNKNYSSLETNGYFDSKVLSRTHAEVWDDNGKVFIKDLKSSNGTFVNGRRISAENKESEPVELHDCDSLEFGIDIINEQDRKVMFRKVAAIVHINNLLNGELSGGHILKNVSSLKRRPGRASLVNTPEGSIYASLESELYCARDENRHLIEMSGVLTDVSNKLEGRNHNVSTDDKSILFGKIEETQAKFRAHIDKCDLEKKAVEVEFTNKLEQAIFLRNEYKEKSLLYERKVKQLEDSLKTTRSRSSNQDSVQIDELKRQIYELSRQLEYAHGQLQDEQIIYSEHESKLRNQISELTSQLNSTRGELEDIQLLNESEVDELKHQIREMMSQVNDTRRESDSLQVMYSSDVDNLKQRIHELVTQLNDTRNELEDSQNQYVVDTKTLRNDDALIELNAKHEKAVTEFHELKLKYDRAINEHEALISSINEEHAANIALKDEHINTLKAERLEFLNQFDKFKEETRNAFDTLKQQLTDAREEINKVVIENNNLFKINCEYLRLLGARSNDELGTRSDDIDKIRPDTDSLRVENAKTKTEFPRWRKEKQVEIDRSVEVSNKPTGKSIKYGGLHQKHESTFKDSEWTDETVDHSILSPPAKDKDSSKLLYIKGTFGVVIIGLGAYFITKILR